MSVKIIGTKEVIDSQTGEVFQLDIAERKNDIMARKGWRRTNIKELMNILALVGNKKIQVLNLLIQNINGTNKIELTQREVSKILGIELKTVSTAFTELSALGLIKKIKNCYVLNTQVISAYGSVDNNTSLCQEYGFYAEEKESEREKTASAKIQKKLKAIARIESDIKKINDEEKMKKRNEKNEKTLSDKELNNLVDFLDF
ncbi:replication/maintenance protein RepL [Aliarcobacter butzleri]|uniref:replication/maintenance protein RepL n=1 Tax=Aliarcobacter butzleri TaxID=28197 RepID=UPI0021B18F5A|nr:replication/maintenance protein RepL [Aliarcobacter butzleri]MCT7570369.1 replication/maintenance protein RepL [Aliarcobacter butzleri]MCT7631023.1 replication/maintenance protein RepL [Aliarcobacter butzleri]